MNLGEDSLAERMLLSTLGQPGFMASSRMLGRPVGGSHFPTSYFPKTNIGDNWVYDDKGRVRVSHGSNQIADIMEKGFKNSRGSVYFTPDERVSQRILGQVLPGTDGSLTPQAKAVQGSNILRGWVDKDVVLRGLLSSPLREIEGLMDPNQANKVFNVGPKPNISTMIQNALTPEVIPNQYIGPVNIDERLGLNKDSYAYHQKLGTQHGKSNTINLAKALGSIGRALPVMGQTLGAIDVTNRFDRGDWFGAGLSGLGMIPVAGLPALAGLGAYDAYGIVNNPMTGPEPMSIASAFTTPQYGAQAYRSFDSGMPDPTPTEGIWT